MIKNMTEQDLEIIKNNMFIDYHEELEADVIEACEKQVKRKPKIKYAPSVHRDCFYCSTCGGVICSLDSKDFEIEIMETKSCRHCGQLINWSEKK